MNKLPLAVIALSLLAGTCCYQPHVMAQTEKPKAIETSAQICFAKLKKLAGDWTHKDDKSGKDTVVLRYRVISGGTAVEEEMMPGTAFGMTSIYHLDNGNLVMTHYCSIGNQPHLKAAKTNTATKMEFECSGMGGTNMKSENDMHIHRLVLSVLSDDHLTAEWSANKDGKQAGPSEKYEYFRKAK